MSNPNNSEDSAIVQINAARIESAKAGGKCLERAFASVDGIVQLQIESVNAFREAGIHFNQCSGREQLTFNGNGFNFVRDEIFPHLPERANMNHVRLAVHLAATLPAPIKTNDQLLSVKKEVQQMLVLSGLIEAPSRKELQTGRVQNPFIVFIGCVGNMRQCLEKLELEKPIEQWPTEDVEEFIEDASPVEATISRARRILSERESTRKL